MEPTPTPGFGHRGYVRTLPKAVQALLGLLAVIVGAACGVLAVMVVTGGFGSDDDQPSQDVVEAEAGICVGASNGATAYENRATGGLAGVEAASMEMVFDAGFVEESLSTAPDDIDEGIRTEAEAVVALIDSDLSTPEGADQLGAAFASLVAACNEAQVPTG